MEKVYKSLSENGAFLIFEEYEYYLDKAKKTLEKMQEHGYVRFKEMKLLSSPPSKDKLLYAIK
jgi:tRNA A58 N-methylase Trm61